jgi:SAM-dependent methyltransferase
VREPDETINFDRAAEFYDATRDVGDAVTDASIDLLATSFAGRGRVLEVGVGTGFLAVPRAAGGLDLVGVDVSTAMVAKLRRKEAGASVRVALADARRLATGSCGVTAASRPR